MGYTTGWYLLFLFCCFFLFWIIPHNYRWIVIFAGNLIFVFFNSSAFQICSFIILNSIVYLCGIWIYKADLDRRKLRLWISLMVIIFPLVLIRLVKIVDIQALSMPLLTENHVSMAHLMPIGISFWTLEMITYLCDVASSKMVAYRNPLKLITFFSFFPTVISGPIERIGKLDLLNIVESTSYDSHRFEKALRSVLLGFFLKLMIADRAKIYVDAVFDNWRSCNILSLWIGAFLYSIQLYADFLGCMKIVGGSALFLGIELTENFKRPYFSESVAEFWRRWHVSLSNWLRDFVYIPLGGNRRGLLRQCVNLSIVFLIFGIWHGGGFTFIFWGALHALYQIVGLIVRQIRLLRSTGSIKFFRIILTNILITIAWVVFRSDTIEQAFGIIHRLVFGGANIEGCISFWELGLGIKQWILLILLILSMFVFGIIQERRANSMVIEKTQRKSNSRIAVAYDVPVAFRYGFYIVCAMIITIFGVYGYGFEAQDFIYSGF